MTRTEKVREAIADAIPVVSLHGSSDETARLIEALSLLDGCVIVPREATEGMFMTGMFMTGRPPNEFWRAMVVAAEEGE